MAVLIEPAMPGRLLKLNWNRFLTQTGNKSEENANSEVTDQNEIKLDLCAVWIRFQKLPRVKTG